MASREEEKRRRREEREAQERARAAAQQRQQRLRVGGAVVLALAALGGAAALALGGGSDDAATTARGGDAGRAAIPAPRVTDLQASVRGTGCVFRELPSEGQGHTTSSVTYKSNPPTSGEHDPEPAADGLYRAGNSPTAERAVHALEHGRVLIQWKPGLPPRAVAQLRSLFDEQDAYHTLLLENQTQMPYEVAISSWTRYLGCPTFSPKVFDALRNFRARYTDQAPERVP